VVYCEIEFRIFKHVVYMYVPLSSVFTLNESAEMFDILLWKMFCMHTCKLFY